MNIEWSYVVALVALGFGVVLSGVAALLARRLRGLRAELDAARDDVAALFSAGTGVGLRLDSVEERLRRVTERMEQWELSEPFKRSYKQAMNLIDTGADVQDLIDQCGVTRGEAELLSDLRRLSALRESADGKRAASF
jgi:hypothetical protein